MSSKSPCIYAIWFPESQDESVYVGQTVHLPNRRREHLRNAASTYPGSKKLYNWMRLRASEGFTPEFTCLQFCSQEEMNDLEDVWQAFFKDFGWKCKHLKGGTNQKGYIPTPEHRENMRQAALVRARRPHSAETKRKIGEANSGLIRSSDQLEAMRIRSSGKKQSPETIAKRMAKLNDPKAKSERIAKVVAKTTGQKRTPETRERMRQAQLGKKASPETRKKLSEMRKGVKRQILK